MRPAVGGARRRRRCARRPDHHRRADRDGIGGGRELRHGERRGLPANQVAWGRLSGDAAIRNLLKIHRLEVDLAEKTLPIAQQRGSNLLSQIVTTLQDGHKFPGAPNIAEPVRLAILIGHEHNIAHIERLLNLRLGDSGLPGQRGIARQRARLRAVPRILDRPALCAAGLLRADAQQMSQATVLNLPSRRARPPST